MLNGTQLFWHMGNTGPTCGRLFSYTIVFHVKVIAYFGFFAQIQNGYSNYSASHILYNIESLSLITTKLTTFQLA